MNNDELKSNLLCASHWIRLVFMVLFILVLEIAIPVMLLVVVVQFLFSLVTGNDNSSLRQFGSSLSKFIYQTLQFLTYNSESKSFPFADWPEAEPQTAKAKPVAASIVPADTPETAAVQTFETVEAQEAEDSIRQEDA
tara:strand:+ start:175 stop:588 length:414 start_codon:yes stop_codon:yes gene_type:complete